ncbi:MAG: ribonuclease HI [Bacteroidetes bacterium]|nr:ribonuclease HI [Bacteroidota bacterium]
MEFIEIYTDGSCHTQQCIGAWASVLLYKEGKITLSGSESDTTHNRMEILAVTNSIKHVIEHFPQINEIKIISDSQYVIGLIDREKKFIAGNYKTKAGIDIRNVDLVKELLTLLKTIKVEFTKIKAHQKPSEATKYNIEVDKLCREIVRKLVKE